MGKFLESCVIAVTGSFGEARPLSVLQVWVEFNGGVFVDQVDRLTTHLICSEEDYKNEATKGERKGDNKSNHT
jgi:hypothetical protein